MGGSGIGVFRVILMGLDFLGLSGSLGWWDGVGS